LYFDATVFATTSFDVLVENSVTGRVEKVLLATFGTVKNLTATNNAGQTWTITNPTTTPNLSLVLTKVAVGLENVDNTSDANKPISSATQTALNGKQPLLNGIGFVKANGSIISYDNSTYVTSASLNNYLPLTGGSLSGALNGVGAIFSGIVSLASAASGFYIGSAGSQNRIDNINGVFRFLAANDGYAKIEALNAYFGLLNDSTGVARMVTTTNGVLGYQSIPSGSGTYSLPIATSSVLGGIKIGTGLSIDASTGVLSATGAGANNFSTNVLFSGGLLTIQRSGLSDISVSLDGRYLTSITSGQVTTALGFTPISSVAHTHGIADTLGTQQFTFGVGDNIRFAGAGNIAVTFDAATKKIIFTGTAGSGADGNNFPSAVSLSNTGIITIARSGLADISSAAATGTWDIAITGNAATASNMSWTGLTGITGGADSTTFLRGDGVWAVPVAGGGGGGITSLSVIGNDPNNEGATIGGSVLTLQPAGRGTTGGKTPNLYGGVVTIGEQTFGGHKIFDDIRVSVKHIEGYGGYPTTAAGNGAGTSPAIFIEGSDLAGLVGVTVGAGAGLLQAVVTVTFVTPYNNAPYVVITPADFNASVAGVYVNSTVNGFSIIAGSTALTNGSQYKWYYHVFEGTIAT